MTEDIRSQADSGGISRRSLIKRAGAGAALAWTAPAISSLAVPAYAAGSPGGGGPNPECSGARCGTFTATCSTNPDCVCTTTNTGGGFCVPGSTLCSPLLRCFDGVCPPGSLCVVNTCCVDPVCVPTSLTCPPSTSTNSFGVFSAPEWPEGSIARS